METLNKASRASVLVENIKGAKLNLNTKDDSSSSYSAQEREELAAAVALAEQVETDMKETVNTTYFSPFHTRKEKQVYVDTRKAVMAHVNGGIGPVFLGMRGDFEMCRNLLMAKNKHGISRFVSMLAGKFILDEVKWPGSDKFWCYQYECKDYYKLVRRMRTHSELEKWDVRDLGAKPMDFVSTDRAIYDHLSRLVSARDINPETANPADFFSPERKVKCIKSWLDAMDEKYDNKEEW